MLRQDRIFYYLENFPDTGCILIPGVKGVSLTLHVSMCFSVSSQPVLQPWRQAADLQGQFWESIHGFYWEVLQNAGTRLPAAERSPKLHEICEYHGCVKGPENLLSQLCLEHTFCVCSASAYCFTRLTHASNNSTLQLKRVGLCFAWDAFGSLLK